MISSSETNLPYSSPSHTSVWQATCSSPWPIPSPRTPHYYGSRSASSPASQLQLRPSNSSAFKLTRKKVPVHLFSGTNDSSEWQDNSDSSIRSIPFLPSRSSAHQLSSRVRNPLLDDIERDWKRRARYIIGDGRWCLLRAECLSLSAIPGSCGDAYEDHPEGECSSDSISSSDTVRQRGIPINASASLNSYGLNGTQPLNQAPALPPGALPPYTLPQRLSKYEFPTIENLRTSTCSTTRTSQHRSHQTYPGDGTHPDFLDSSYNVEDYITPEKSWTKINTGHDDSYSSSVSTTSLRRRSATSTRSILGKFAPSPSSITSRRPGTRTSSKLSLSTLHSDIPPHQKHQPDLTVESNSSLLSRMTPPPPPPKDVITSPGVDEYHDPFAPNTPEGVWTVVSPLDYSPETPSTRRRMSGFFEKLLRSTTRSTAGH